MIIVRQGGRNVNQRIEFGELSIWAVRFSFGQESRGKTGLRKEEVRRDVGNGDDSDADHFHSGAVYGRVAGAAQGVRLVIGIGWGTIRPIRYRCFFPGAVCCRSDYGTTARSI